MLAITQRNSLQAFEGERVNLAQKIGSNTFTSDNKVIASLISLKSKFMLKYKLLFLKVVRYSSRQVGSCEPKNLLDLLVPKWRRYEEKGGRGTILPLESMLIYIFDAFSRFYTVAPSFLVKK
jgi:hypothetical protein